MRNEYGVNITARVTVLLFDLKPFSVSLLTTAVSIGIALHHFNASTTIIGGHASSLCLVENGVPIRGALGEISIHRAKSLARPRVCAMLLEKNGTVIRARKCFFRACRVMPMLCSACAEGLRTRTWKVTVLNGGCVRRELVSRWSLKFRAEGFCDTVLRIGRSACEEGGVSGSSLLGRSPSFGCCARGGWLSCGVGCCLVLSIHRRTAPGMVS